MSPTEKLRKLEAMFLEQTGKSMDDFGSVEEALVAISFRANNEQIMANALNSVPDEERRVIQLWRQMVPVSGIAAGTDRSEAARRGTL